MKHQILLYFVLFFLPLLCRAQDQDSSLFIREITKFQQELNREFSDPEGSPLKEKDLESFESLEFFTPDLSFRVKASLKKTPEEKPFQMKTSTDREPFYRKYGEACFERNGKKYCLSIFQNLRLLGVDDYKDYLFLPFTDLTNGSETYGGGRYIGLRIPDGDTIIIDFNKAYNPYCAYNEKYSCPIPPRENFLDIEVKAGVKNFTKENTDAKKH